MKKIYVTFLSLAVMGSAFAQTNNDAIKGRAVKSQSPIINSGIKVNDVPVTEKATVWGPNTMSNAGEWTMVDNSTPTASWVIGTAGPSGSFSSTYGTIASTTAADGFAMFDSDALGDNTSNQSSDIYFTTPIDLTGQNSVAVEFQTLYSHYQGTCYVIASTDGNTWTEIQVLDDVAVNTASSPNPRTVTANVSSIIGGSNTAYIGFRYVGGWDYAWMVDDVCITTLPDNDIALTRGWHADIVNDYEYSMTPLTQVREMIAGVVVENTGGMAQTVDVTCDVTDGNSTLASSMQSVTLNPAEVDTLWYNTGVTPSANGDYWAEFSIPADMVTSNDNYTTSVLTVNDDLMAHDYGATTALGWDPNATDPSNAQAPHSWGNIYYPQVDQQIWGVDVNFAAGTTAGLYLLIRCQEMDPSGSIQDPLIWNNETDYTIPQTAIGSGITTIPFPAPSLLEAGKGYMIDVLKVDATNGNETFNIGASDASGEDDDFAAIAYGPFGANNAVNYWLAWNASPLVRANFDATLSVNETALEGVSVYPNPSEGLITVSNNNNDNNTIVITNLAGQVVYTEDVSAEATVDLAGFGSGVYVVTVSNENGFMTERVVIK